MPSSAMPSISSRSSLWSMSFCTATGRTRSSTNWRTVSWISRCSSVSSKSIGGSLSAPAAWEPGPSTIAGVLGRAVVLFTRDLRVRDNPALAAAAREAADVVPLFVLDPAILDTPYGRSANRRRFLAQSLRDLDGALRQLGSPLVVRRGDTVAEVAKL